MNKCGCNKIQKGDEPKLSVLGLNSWMQGLCNSCGSEIIACSWDCSLEICQNCKRDLVIYEVLDLGEIVKNS